MYIICNIIHIYIHAIYILYINYIYVYIYYIYTIYTIYIYVYIYICMYICIYIYTHAYVYTHIYTYILRIAHISNPGCGTLQCNHSFGHRGTSNAKLGVLQSLAESGGWSCPLKIGDAGDARRSTKNKGLRKWAMTGRLCRRLGHS